MKSIDRNHSDHLREGLLALYHSGPRGFEGLVGVILASITGQPFRLAKSGTQRGRDGDTAFDGGATYFEAKRYRKNLNKTEIAAKYVDLVSDDTGQVDLWVLGATCEIAAQTTTELRSLFDRIGVGFVLLDWSENDLGALLVAAVNAGDKTKDFIRGNLSGKAKAHVITPALDAIDYFAKHPDLPARVDALRKALSLEEIGLGQARSLNREWLTEVLSSRNSARAEFGQPLAPLDDANLTAIPRHFEDNLGNAFTGRPHEDIYAVIGDEGVGKSWLVVSTWLASDSASILVIVPAEDIPAPKFGSKFEGFLIDQLIYQTGGQRSERATQRWRRRIKGWRANPAPTNVRLTLVFDGLNQAANPNWSRHLDYAASELVRMGGCLVITTRSTHWTHIRHSLTSSVASVSVAQWTVPEVKNILQGRGIDSGKVKPDVLQSLRNPRILGIAIDLLSANDVERIDQLSVGRLMFEHLRKAQVIGAASMSGSEFADLLRNLANQILQRTQNKSSDDILLFDIAEHNGLNDVSSTRFFVPIKGRHKEYEIKQDGLNLGLALSLKDALEKELRNGRDPRERLSVILDPLSTLDEAASVVFLATQIACLDNDTSPEVITVLLEQFVSFQNLPVDEAEAFAVLARSATPSFLVAAQNVYCSKSHIPNEGWLLYALCEHRDDPQVWEAISTAVKRWLSVYSPAPERMMFKLRGRDPDVDVNVDREKRKKVIEDKLLALTKVEQRYLQSRLELTDQWDFDPLHRLAFYLLAGKPLASFAEYLFRWSFSNSVTPSVRSPLNEFRQMIRFNCVDWSKTRDAMLEKIDPFKSDNSSTVGKWSTVQVLRATGDIEDAKRAEELAERLSSDREKFTGWALVEKYCSNDPCDPHSTKPDNITATAKKYRKIDPSRLACMMGQTKEGHFFSMARAGVARFLIDDAVFAHRALADNVLTRTEFSRRQGALALLEHSSALTNLQAKSLLSAGQVNAAPIKNESKRCDEWLTAQYSVFTALPHLSPDEQLEAVVGIQSNTVLLDVLDALLPASELTAERVLELIMQTGDEDKQGIVLGALRYSRPPLSVKALEIVSRLIGSANAIVRAQALGIAAGNADEKLLKEVVSSGWDASPLISKDQRMERWNGSLAILEAATAGLIDNDEALNRMDLSLYGFAAQSLDPDGTRAVAKRVEAALVEALNYKQTPELPDIAISSPQSSPTAPPLVRLSDPPPNPENEGLFDRLCETNEQFDARQEQAVRSFEIFVNDLTKIDAELILSDMSLEGIKALIEVDSMFGKRMLGMLNSASEIQLRHLHHVAMQIAIVLSSESSARKLLRRLVGLKPTINRVEGLAKIPAEYLALWRNADSAKLRSICKNRLLSRQNDSEVALEVLVAIMGGQEAIIQETVEELLATGQPIDTCLALTIAGFSDQSEFTSKVIAQFEGTQGFIGIARKKASYAYERNAWARVWYMRMLSANSPTDFWQASVLFTKIVDGRFVLWAKSFEMETDIYRAFCPTIFRLIERRIEKWQKKRQDSLFGDKVPDGIFLRGN